MSEKKINPLDDFLDDSENAEESANPFNGADEINGDEFDPFGETNTPAEETPSSEDDASAQEITKTIPETQTQSVPEYDNSAKRLCEFFLHNEYGTDILRNQPVWKTDCNEIGKEILKIIEEHRGYSQIAA